MLKKVLVLALGSLCFSVYADNMNASQGYTEAKQAKQVSNGDNQAPDKFDPNKSAVSAQANSPTVSSFAASSQLFPQQNQLTGTKGQKYYSESEMKNHQNNPNVNSFAYSGAQFPNQNTLTGTKGQKYYSESQVKHHTNNPTVNSRLSSANMFPQENSFNHNGKTVESAD